MAKSFDIFFVNNLLYTLKPDGSEYQQLIGANYDKNRIGEYKKQRLYFNVAPYDPQSLANLTIYFSPALFFFNGTPTPFGGGKPNEGWAYTVDNAVTPGTYSMTQYVSGAYQTGLTKNYEVSITIVDADDFYIDIKYYHLYDLLSFMDSTKEQNRFKLLKDRANNPDVLTVSLNSVYTTPEVIPQYYVHIRDDSNVLVNSNVLAKINGYKAGFYGKDEHQQNPYFTNPVFRLTDGSTTVPGLLLAQDTKLEFEIDSPTLPKNIYLWLIRVDTNDNAVDFIANYDASHIDCVLTGGSATIDNKFKAPATDPTLVGAGKYRCTVWIDHTLLNYNETYRIIGIPYYFSLPQIEVNSFISDEIRADGLPQFTGEGYDFQGSIVDYLNEYFGNDLIVIVEERLKSKLNIQYFYQGFATDIYNRLGLTVDNDIRRYLTQIMVEVYETSGVTVQYFERLVADKLDPVTYNTPQGLTLNFEDDSLLIEYDFRVRYEDDVLNIQTTVGGGLLLTPTGNQDWAGRDLKIKYSLKLFYDDYETPFSDTLVFIQNLRPKDYEPAVIEIKEQDNTPITDDTYFCSDDNTCLKSELTITDPQKYKLITTIEKAPGSITTIEEHEVFTGELPQQTTTKIFSQEEQYSETEANHAKFCLSNTNFFINQDYKISAMAKKQPCTNASGFLTMDAPQNDDNVILAGNSFLYLAGPSKWQNNDIEQYDTLKEAMDNDTWGTFVPTVTQFVNGILVEANICGIEGNVVATNSPDRVNFHWDPATEAAGTLTGGTG